MTKALSPATLRLRAPLDRLPAPAWEIIRGRTIMVPQHGNPNEAEGVLNPASARTPDGTTLLFPRIVAKGNRSAISVVRVLRDPLGEPLSVQRMGVALEPDKPWEQNARTAGVEDGRITRIDALGLHVMTYTAYGPLGPRIWILTSDNLMDWRRVGPVTFQFDPRLGTDLNLVHNKDGVFFPEPVPGPDGRPSFALIHRPDWEFPNRGGVARGRGRRREQDKMVARGLEPRPGMWISYVAVEDVAGDVRKLTHFTDHRLIATSEMPWEGLKIGAGPPPVRVPEGWLLVYHGVEGTITEGVDQQPGVRYCAGAMILDAADPSLVIARTRTPLLRPQRASERVGTVGNVVFPTAIEPRPDGAFDLFYGAADSTIAAAVLRPIGGGTRPHRDRQVRTVAEGTRAL